ncbi:daptide biosynthesis intramembrane metalloprotease [Microbacterium sp. 1.5R]|uniref:daptide biosynthesis intramembrane metalloprotease n=1 Tax=Microbacterium sp. 1.5R TaxID=1916917 RepID=UPI0028CB6839|nr:daptide biosynthesis intramembrane metalloprotease [Microbacterium sp. 1.5R]
MPSPRFPLRSARRADTPLRGDARPRLAHDVTFERAEDGRWITLLHGVPASRVSGDVVALLAAMDGETMLDDLRRRFAASEGLETFLRLVERFRASGLLDDAPRTPPGRVSFRPPFTVQLATMHAPVIFDRLTRFAAPTSSRDVVLPLAVLLGVGVLAAALQAEELWHVIVSPVPLGALVVVVVGLASLTLLHEGAHGMTLAYFGGRPRRAGFMLFYLAPAFFVDVTDGWRLRDRRQRVAVALAGPAVHAGVGATAVVTALAVAVPEVDRVLLLLAISCTAIVAVNLIPFVRFDGYLALMSALDEPNLRDRSIRDANHAMAWMLFGAPRDGRSLDRRWSVPFGLASVVTPIVLVLLAVTRIGDALAAGGPAGGVVVMAVEAAVVCVGAVLLVRGLRRILRAGVSRVRFWGVLAALVVSVAGAGSLVTVPVSAAFGFFPENGRVMLAQATAGSTAGMRPTIPREVPVVLTSNGILGNEYLGSGTASPRPLRPVTAPLESFVPVTASGASIPAVIVAEVVVTDASGDVDIGRAVVDLGTQTLWQALWAAGVEAPLSTLLSEK